VQGGTHGGNEMYVEANLNKMVQFFDAAREAKLAKAPETDPDSTARDSLTSDSTLSLMRISRNWDERGSYNVYGLNGTLVIKSAVFDGSRLKPGAYYVVVFTRSGSRRSFGYIKR